MCFCLDFTFWNRNSNLPPHSWHVIQRLEFSNIKCTQYYTQKSSGPELSNTITMQLCVSILHFLSKANIFSNGLLHKSLYFREWVRFWQDFFDSWGITFWINIVIIKSHFFCISTKKFRLIDITRLWNTLYWFCWGHKNEW